jgi:hypothetical protein
VRGVAFEPTEEQRRTVRAMAGLGIPQPDIATLLEIDPKTLRLRFRTELDRGAVEATAKVAQSLFRMATQGGNVAAAIFWMKARAGWRERHDVTLRPGAPLAELSDAELQRIALGDGADLAGDADLVGELRAAAAPDDDP